MYIILAYARGYAGLDTSQFFPINRSLCQPRLRFRFRSSLRSEFRCPFNFVPSLDLDSDFNPGFSFDSMPAISFGCCPLIILLENYLATALDFDPGLALNSIPDR
ncbi:hypothetical protein EVAR_42023_1 [Eumeta japonica]|uniref:Uncharacterized protein n=1 Tax=Eumeta variegata TaxID=151549 RepID=A0A4C1Y6N1_EUMVA|nr:hypothetical protein EVAR_42023_1 [Eumeta japonica]